MDKQAFNRHVKDALNNLYDYAALEIHPLVDVVPKNFLDRCESRAEGVRRFLIDAIDKLQPPEVSDSAAALAWRPYRILHGRYVECLDLKTLQEDLGLSARQLRREHARSLEALTALAWEQIPAADPAEGLGSPEGRPERGDSARHYPITRERLDLVRILEGVIAILQNRIQSAHTSLRLTKVPDDLPKIWADRIILRQILLSLISSAFQTGQNSDVLLEVTVASGWVDLAIGYRTEGRAVPTEEETSLATARQWAQRLGVQLEHLLPGFDSASERRGQFTLSLPTHKATVLVVDDQDAAVRMFTRYLSRCDIQVIGIREPEAVLPSARTLQPQCITLDLMMPTMDGWEILQSLRNDPDTQAIPVIVCSVWNEPELAASLGASDFLRKPVMQKHLLDALSRLGLLGTSDGARPAGT
jgi:CheY-like chemotaxis protein